MSARISRLPEIQQNLSLSSAAFGAALSAIWIGSLIAMPVTGWLIHRVGGRRMVLIALALLCLTLPPIGLAPSFGLLATAFAAFGAAAGAMGVSMNAEGVAVEQAAGRPIMASLHGLFSLGAMAGAAVGGAVASAGLSPAAHFAAAAVTFGAIGLLAGRSLPAVATEPSIAPIRSLVLDRRVVALGLLAFCILVGEGAMADWTGIYLRSVAGAGVGEAAAGFAVFSAMMAIGRLSGDALCIRIGRVWLVRGGALLAAAGLSLALAVGTKWAALLGFGLAGAGFSSIIPTTYSAAGRAGLPRGTAIATVTMMGYFGFLAGPAMIGWTAEQAGLRTALAIVPALALVAAALSGRVEPRHNV